MRTTGEEVTEDATQAGGLCGVAIKLIGMALDGSPPEGRARLLKDSRALLERAGDKLAGAANWKAPEEAFNECAYGRED